MKKLLQEGSQKIAEGSIKFKKYITNLLKDERGEGPLSTILFVAIVILAIIFVSDDIRGVFSDVATYFRDSIITQITSILS